MSPRLDDSRLPTTAHVDTPVRNDRTPSTHGSPTSAPDGLRSRICPEIPPFDEVGPVDARALSKTLFERLESLEEGTHEYAYVRDTLIELNLALVRFAAARFRSRNEPMEDIVQVGTIGLIKAIDRFDSSAAWSSRRSRCRPSSARSSASSATRRGRCGCRAGSRSCGSP